MFGSSNPFGQTSNSSFGSPSVFGQNNNNNANNSPFGQNPFGSPSPFGSQTGSSIFGGTSTGVFGTQASSPLGSTSVFGASSAPAFGSSAFGQKPAFGGFGSTTPQSSPFGSSFQQSQPAFGNSLFGSSAFGASSQPAFGATSTPAFGSASTPTFGNTGSAFGVSSSPVFGSSTPAFGATSSPSPFSFGSTPGFGQTQTTSAFGGQSSPFGAQSTTPAFGSPGFGQSQSQQRGGTRVTPFAQTPEADSGTGTQTAGKLESISAMPAYKEKSHEELRWEDYQLGDKGGPNPNPGQSNLFSSSPAFSQPSANPFSSTTSTNSFAPKTSTFGASTSNPFGSTPSPTPSLFGSTPAFGQTTSASLFGTPSTSTFGTSTSIFGTTQAQDQTSSFATGLNFGNSQPSPLFQSTTPSLGQTTSPFGQTAPAFGQSNAFGGNMFSSTPTTSTMGFNQTTPSLSTPFQSAQNTGGFGSSSIFGQITFGQPSANQSATLVQQQQQQQQSITNPFGTLPAMPQMSIGRAGTAPSIQYGISSLPVVEKPAPMRISSVLTSRHLSQRRIRLPARKYHPKNDSPKVSFFIDEEDTATSTPKADALFIPRENPRALVIRPLDQKTKNISSPAQDNGEYTEFPSTTHLNGRSTDNGYRNHPENGFPKEQQQQTKPTHKSNGTHDDQSNPNPNPKPDSYITLNGHRAGEAAMVYEHGADIEALMPKLRHSDYYTRPKIQELAAKERAEPGFCRHVNDFVVGRHDFGSIKFFGETDVRRLELESLIQFNNREVIVYMDETKKPPAGQGLNKPAEVTLLNIKCFDKKTGKCFTEGSRVEKYKEMLRKKAEDQGAEFVSYDPVLGEWKFRVSHFSRYGLDDDDDDDVTV